MSRRDPTCSASSGIIAGPQHQIAKAAVRDAGTSILRNGMNDVGFAALDQYFGDHFADGSALRDGVKMTLALVPALAIRSVSLSAVDLTE